MKLLSLSLLITLTTALVDFSGSGVIMPSTPLQVPVPLEEQNEALNVLIMSSFGGSGKKVMDALAYDLSTIKWEDSGLPMFNVTLFSSMHNTKMIKKEHEHFHVLRMDFDVNSFYPPEGPQPGGLIAHENKIMDHILFGGNATLLQSLRDTHFVAGISIFLHFDQLVVKKVGAPCIRWISYLPDPLLTVAGRFPFEFPGSMPTLHIFPKLLHGLGHKFTLNKIFMFMFGNSFNFMVNHVFYPRSRFMKYPEAEENLRLFDDMVNDLLFGDGYHGVREIKQEAPSVYDRLPAARKASQHYGKGSNYLGVPEEYSAFLDRFPKGSVLVAFGTTFMPKPAGIEAMLDAARQMPHTGFIISLKEYCDAYKLVQEAALPNVNLQTFVPQLALLNDPRIFAFISHGGGNSILESLYYGKVLIGFPQAADQLGAAYRVEQLGVGVSVKMEPSAYDIVHALETVRPAPGQTNAIQDKMKRVQKIIHFKELRQGKDTAYLLRMVAKFNKWSGGRGTAHLGMRHVVDNSFFTVYDYDIKLICLAVIGAAGLAIVLATKQTLRVLRKA